MLDFVELSRLQFALTALYHFLFVPLTLGLSFVLVVMETLYVTTGKEVYKDMWDTIQSGKIWTGIVPNVGKGGVVYVVDTTVQPIFDAEGKITSYISVRRVINDLMQNFDAVELSKEIFDDFYDK